MMRRMDRRAIIAAYRAGFGALTVVAIAAQLLDIAGRGKLDLLNYFSCFTIDSNSSRSWCSSPAPSTGSRNRRRCWASRGASAVYMAVVGIVFSLLLSNTDVDTALRDGLTWLAYPAVWLAFTLIKGPIVGKYPSRSSTPRTADTARWPSTVWRSWWA
jgi:hypothetical protein